MRLIGIYKDSKIFRINNKKINEYYEKKFKTELDEITIIYSINKKNYDIEYIRLFGEKFVKNNKECKIIINNEKKK